MNLHERIANTLIECIETKEYDARTFPKDALLFGPAIANGLGLDSIASLEIISALSLEFGLSFDDIRHDDMMSVNTIADYVSRQLAQREAVCVA